MLDLPFETRFIDVGQARLECLTAGEGAPRVAILLHGFPEAHFSWRHQIGFLAARGFEVWAPNQRGYGGSSRPAGVASYHLRHLTADVAGLIDQVAAGRPVTLIGHDWGAITAWTFAVWNLRPLDRLVAMNVPHPTVFGEVLRTSPRQRQMSWYITFFQIPWLPEWAMGLSRAQAVADAFSRLARDKAAFPASLLDAYRANAQIPGALTAMINWYRSAVRSGVFADFRRESVARIAVPTLLVWGEEDDALSLDLTRGYDGLVEDFTLRTLPGVSHWVQQEAPDAVNAILAEWLGLDGPGQLPSDDAVQVRV